METEGRIVSAEEKAAILAGVNPKKEETKQENEGTDKKNLDTKVEETKSTDEGRKDFDFSVFKKYNREIENEDALLSLFEKADKSDSLTSEIGSLKEQLEDYKSIADRVDPLAHFLNEDEYMRQQLLITKKDELKPDVIKELSVLTPNKVKELSDVDALVLSLMVDKGVSKDKAEAYLLRKYDVSDLSDPDIEAGVKSAIEIDAVDARRSVSKLYEGITIPKKAEIESSRQEVKQAWDTFLPTLKKDLTKIQIAEGVDLNVTQSMLDGISLEATRNELMKSGIKPSEAAAEAVWGSWKNQIVLNNLDAVLEASNKVAIEKNNAEWRAKVHNDKPLDDGGSRGDHARLSNDERAERAFL